MKHTLTFALAGGDVRQAYLGGLLAADGAQVRTIGLERSGTELEAVDFMVQEKVLPLP